MLQVDDIQVVCTHVTVNLGGTYMERKYCL